MRIRASENDIASLTVELNNRDVTMLAQWADVERGEVGVYGHYSDGELIHAADSEPDKHAPKLPLIPHPNIARIEDGLYVCRGRVTIRRPVRKATVTLERATA